MEKICIIGKKSVGPKSVEEKMVIYGKNWWVGTKYHLEQIFGIPSANICLTPPLWQPILFRLQSRITNRWVIMVTASNQVP